MSNQLPSPSRSMWTERQLAEFLGVSMRTVQAWRQRGGGPKFQKVASAVRYAPNDVECWLATRTRLSTSDPGHLAS